MKVTDDGMVQTIEFFIREHGYGPSVRDLVDLLGLGSPSTVQKRLERLREQGKVDWVPGRARTIRVVVDAG